MPHITLNKEDLLLLRDRIDSLESELKRPQRWKLMLPKDNAEVMNPGNVIKASEVFMSVLAMISGAINKLKDSDVAIDIGKEPVKMHLTATMAGISNDGNDILLRI